MTSETKTPAHLKPEQLLAYFEDRLPDADGAAIEEHMAVCDACAHISRRVYGFHQAWEGWTALTHGGVYLRETLDAALSKAEGQTLEPSWQARLRRWRESWAGTAQAALHAVIEIPGETARVVAAGVDALTRPGSQWSFAPETSFAGTLGDTHGDDSDDHAIFATGALSAEAPRALVELKGGEKGDIVVRIDNLPTGTIPPLVVLIAVKSGGKLIVQVTSVKRQLGTESFVARFAKVPPGEYIVAFEPFETETDTRS